MIFNSHNEPIHTIAPEEVAGATTPQMPSNILTYQHECSECGGPTVPYHDSWLCEECGLVL